MALAEMDQYVKGGSPVDGVHFRRKPLASMLLAGSLNFRSIQSSP